MDWCVMSDNESEVTRILTATKGGKQLQQLSVHETSPFLLRETCWRPFMFPSSFSVDQVHSVSLDSQTYAIIQFHQGLCLAFEVTPNGLVQSEGNLGIPTASSGIVGSEGDWIALQLPNDNIWVSNLSQNLELELDSSEPTEFFSVSKDRSRLILGTRS